MIREIRDLFYSIKVPSNRYLQYLEGNTNIILTAPHGGGMKPVQIPKRKTGTSTMDTYTRRLTNMIYSLFHDDDKPDTLIADIHRSRVDLNRYLFSATDGNKKAIDIWKDWDISISSIKSFLRKRFNNIIYVDIHSHNDGNYFELGYNLNAFDYLALERNGKTTKQTTMDSISGSVYDKLFGDYSIKKGLEWYGYEVFRPSGDEVYFNGGRNVEVYSGFGVGGIQIECPVSILKNDLESVAYSIKDCITTFRNEFAPKKIPLN